MIRQLNSHLRLWVSSVGILAILLFNGWFLYYNFQNVSEQEERVSHTSQVLVELEQVMSSMKDAETGVRGYALTRNQQYLEPYRVGSSQVWSHLKRLKDLTVDNSEQQANTSVLEEMIRQRLLILESLMSKVEKEKVAARAIEFSDGRVIMDTLRNQVGKMQSHEEVLLRRRSADVRNSKYFFYWALALTTFFTALLILIAFYQISKVQERDRLEKAAKNREAWEKEIIAASAKAMAGDVTPQDAGKAILELFARKFNVLAGRMFLFQHGSLALISSVGATESVDSSDESMDVQSSLVNAAFERGQIWQVTDIPAEYWKVSSSFGAAVPKAVVFMPFFFQGRRLGVVEIAAFHPFSPTYIETMEKMAETVGIGMNAAQSREFLQELLMKTQEQSEELQAQQEKLKASNEELEQQARALESQQQALNTKNRDLESAQRELEFKASDLLRSSQYKSEFLAKMSHELRTPLNGLLILSTLLSENKEENLTEQQRQFAKSIQSAGNDLLMLINDILDLSKIEARKLTMRPEDFSLEQLFDHIQRTFEPQIVSKGLALQMLLPQELSSLVMISDRQRLEQILRNFLSNAIKFTEKGKITVSVNHDRVGFVTFAVTDSGIGIPEEKQSAIFEAFEQADGSISRRYGGTGLGLTISKELAVLLGGEISLTSQEGKGSTFSVTLPLKMPTAEGVVLSSPSTESAQKAAFERSLVVLKEKTDGDGQIAAEARKALGGLQKGDKSILIVEDDDKFRSSVVEVIKSYGYKPVEASDGEVALALLHQFIPDAILLDIKLPGISGLGILEMIKQMPHLRHIPVHMISALEYQHNALRMGALGYLTKPVTIEKVKSALTRIEGLLSQTVRRVLLIEDDERQSEAISELISGNDIFVVSVKTGKGAVEEIKKQAVDCIILDLTLPDVSGFDLLAELNALDISLPPVVIYTGKDLAPEEEAYLHKYSESIIIKGVRSPERLLDEVNLFLHRMESYLPQEKRDMLNQMRSQEKSFEGKTVLLVDDDIRNIFALTSALESKGLQVKVARDGIEAVEAIEKNKDLDIVLMDVMMPRMNGYEAMRKIRGSNDGRIKDIPIVALTAKAMREDHEKCIEAGASDYLPKPVNLENLTTVLKVWLSPRDFLG